MKLARLLPIQNPTKIRFAQLLAALLTLCPQHARADAEALARIGDTEVKIEEIRAALENLDASARTAMARDPALLKQWVRSLLVQRIVLKEALDRHWEQQPEVVAQLERLRQSTITEGYLQSVAKPPESFPSTAEVQSAYDTNKAALLVPRQFRLAQIFIALPKIADKATAGQAQGTLDAVRKSLRQPNADFGAIARAESDEPTSAGRDGEIGWLAETQIQPEIRTQIVSLSKNTVSEPIQLADGWHILKILDLKEAYTPTLEEVREQLIQQLRTEKLRANSQAYLAKLLQDNAVAVNELALSKLLQKPVAPNTRPAAAPAPLRPAFK